MKKINYLILLMTMAFSMGAMAQSYHHGHGRRNCATAEQMRLTMQALEKESFDDKRTETAILCVTLGHFCTDDLARMARTFTFDDNRTKFLTYAYDYCVDRENYYILKEAFSFSLNYDKMMETIHNRHHRR